MNLWIHFSAATISNFRHPLTQGKKTDTPMRTFQPIFRSRVRFAWVLALALFLACKQEKETPETPAAAVPSGPIWQPYNDSAEVAGNADHPIARMRYKLIQSRFTDKNEVFGPLYGEAMQMSPETYAALRPLILEQPMPVVQEHIKAGRLSYEQLTRFFLYRIYKYELDNATTLNTVIALNPDALRQARICDEVLKTLPEEKRHPIFGMPILLKDNIGAAGMPTTAGAVALLHNRPGDAFITGRLRQNGAIILGKLNLSEWAYYFCEGCPVGYSAVGGQTLNPYGRRVFETGGSSSGSGTAMAVGYAMGAVGTETSGSILSPSGQNSVVGLKPTVGLLGRSGIVPISSTLDTPGPMACNTINAAILLDAMKGTDMNDPKAGTYYLEGTGYLPRPYSFAGKRVGVFAEFLETDSLYARAVQQLRGAGAEIVAMVPPEVELQGFGTLLNADMQIDLQAYLATAVREADSVPVHSASEVVAFNLGDTLLRAPYGQARMIGVAQDRTSPDSLEAIKRQLRQAGRRFFNTPWQANRLEVVLSVNNRHASLAAVAEYPALVVPMGYRATGEPAGLTFIGKPFQEEKLLDMGHAFEVLAGARQLPRAYRE